MSIEIRSNGEFLSGYKCEHQESYIVVLLPHEKNLVDSAVSEQRKAYEEVIDEKVKVTGGDDWHDGAFRATDNQAKIIAQRMSAIRPFIEAPVFDYPDSETAEISLGSRVVIQQSGYDFTVDIVGFREGHPSNLYIDGQDDDIMAISPGSPLARAIIGRLEGDEVKYDTNGREIHAKLLQIDQLGIKNYFMRSVEISKLTEEVLKEE